MLELNTALQNDILVIELEGALDSVSAADFRRYFQEKIAAGYRAFALDCLCLEYISSAGIAAIIDLQTQLVTQSGKMVLYQLSSETRQLLRFLQLEEKLHLTSDYESAIAALTGYHRVVPASDMVAPEELHLVQQESQGEKEQPNVKTAASVREAGAPAPQQGNEMVMEEQIEPDKRGLQPIATPAAAVANAETPAAPTTVVPGVTTPAVVPEKAPGAATLPEAQELKLNTGAKRLISCPNCKSVLRVALAGDYLCPACRFRFVFKPGGA